MERNRESGCAPRQVRCAWLMAVACIATMAWTPLSVLAQEEAAEAATEEVALEVAEPEMTPEEKAEAELDEAQAAIEEAERQLEEAKRQMELMGRKMAEDPVPVPGTDVGLVEVDGRAKKLQWSLNEDGTLYMRMLMWLQVWTRAIQLNPGTEVQGDDNPWYGDVGLRRARLLWFGQIFPRTFILLHVGINNQTFRNARKPQVFFHDAWMEFQVSRNKAFYLGGGLIYWNGISRQTNASTITFMSLDAPIMNWPLIEREDQFARQLGIYAKGKLGLFDYRVAVTRPFTPFDVSLTGGTPAPPPQGGIGNYRDTNAWAYTGYFQFQFQDEESNVLPYTVGTYIGAKQVFNLGFGGYLHPGGVQYGDSEVDPDTGEVTILSSKATMLGILGADLFLDQPFGGDDGGAVTWYGVYQYQNFGPNFIRNVGIMNPGSGGTAFTQFGSGGSAGNAYPMIGTGNHLYTEFGVLLPGHLGQEIKFQPYVNWQGSAFMGFGCGPRNEGEFASVPCTWMHHVGVGLNMFIHRHNAKVTIEYRNRPIFNDDRSLNNRKGNSFVMQWHIFI